MNYKPRIPYPIEKLPGVTGVVSLPVAQKGRCCAVLHRDARLNLDLDPPRRCASRAMAGKRCCRAHRGREAEAQLLLPSASEA